MLYNKCETKIKIMKIQYRNKSAYALVDVINSMSWISAATSITLAGLCTLWGIGSFFILIST